MFKKATLNKKYLIIADGFVKTPDGYSGNISDITDSSVIDGMIARGNNLVALKGSATTTNVVEEETQPPGEVEAQTGEDNTGKPKK